MIREQFRRFADDKVMPVAQGWHERDELIPLELIEELAELGVFGLTLPEAHGGLGMGKVAMCVVTEELSRGYIGVGSLCDPLRDRGRADPARRHRGAAGSTSCRRSRRARSSRPRCSPSPTPAPIWPR